jgi:endonuclease/exonuclease/phosphatase family metal-dependent hydrolase
MQAHMGAAACISAQRWLQQGMRVVLMAAVLALCACPEWFGGPAGSGTGDEPPDGGPPALELCTSDDNTGYPPPADDIVTRVGSNNTLDMATWNIKFFPITTGAIAAAADVITSMDVDIIAVQEIANESAFNQLLQRLPEHNGILSSQRFDDGSLQNVGIIYRCTNLVAKANTLRFTGDGYNFPRSPLFVDFHYGPEDGGIDFTAIVVHLKAGEGGGPDDDSSERRQRAIANLERFVRDEVDGATSEAEENFVIIGDFNQQLDEADASNFDPFQDTSRYVIHTAALTGQRPGSFITSGSVILDHIVTTAGLAFYVGNSTPVIVAADEAFNDFRDDVSDHRPVALRFANSD